MRTIVTKDEGIWIKSTKTLRTLIGVLGVLLPLLLYVFSYNCASQPLESISHYYYTRSGTIFSVVLSLVGVFLIIYTKQFWLSSIAGCFAICVVFFPTSALKDSCSVVTLLDHDYRIGFHYISAAIFLIILGYMSFNYFTKLEDGEKLMDKEKVSYQLLYRVCGIIIFTSILIIGFKAIAEYFYKEELITFIKFYDRNKLTFWFEVFALEAFGIAWLVRGACMPYKNDIYKYLETKKIG